MRTTQFPLNTVKETPADAEIASHQLMIRAGLIRKLAAGLYSWLPLGLRVMRKVEKVTREEMEKIGALEVLMPGLQPAELWQETGRWEQYGPELARLKDRHERDFCLGPTHEEIITDLARNEIKSYKQLPITYYQIQSKFRDEIRPRFGVMRSREFIMKDAYSFHLDQESLQQTYDAMYQAYTNIFNHLGLKFRAVIADSGSIGGAVSHEFHVLADSGEDAIAFSTGSDYAANVEKAEAVMPTTPRLEPKQEIELHETPNVKSIPEVCSFFDVTPDRVLKTLVVNSADGLVVLLLRGDHEVNEIKVSKLPEKIFVPFDRASDLQLEDLVSGKALSTRYASAEFGTNASVTQQKQKALAALDERDMSYSMSSLAGSLGPIGLPKGTTIIADRAVLSMSDFICGANQDGKHYKGVNWERDLPIPDHVADLRTVVEGDLSPDGKGHITLARGIEVGHIFQLGTKYSEAMKAGVINEGGKNQIMTMGCYGIGISRVVAAAIEQNHDEKGIIWPANLAPFQVAICPMNMHKSERLKVASEQLYQELLAAGFDVLFDDRKVRAGFMFSDMELIGIPHCIVVGDRGLDAGTVEYKARTADSNEEIPFADIIDFLKAKLA